MIDFDDVSDDICGMTAIADEESLAEKELGMDNGSEPLNHHEPSPSELKSQRKRARPDRFKDYQMDGTQLINSSFK